MSNFGFLFHWKTCSIIVWVLLASVSECQSASRPRSANKLQLEKSYNNAPNRAFHPKFDIGDPFFSIRGGKVEERKKKATASQDLIQKQKGTMPRTKTQRFLNPGRIFHQIGATRCWDKLRDKFSTFCLAFSARLTFGMLHVLQLALVTRVLYVLWPWDRPTYQGLLAGAALAELGWTVYQLAVRRQGTIRYRTPGGRGLYEGGLRWGKPHGVGRLQLAQGMAYVGEFSRGLPSGRGVMAFPNGGLYVGQMHRGLQEGLGTHLQPDGTSYQGGFRAGRAEGAGRIRFSSGAEYLGGCRAGAPEGWGALRAPNGDAYEGNFRGGLLHGFGTLATAQGGLYRGEFRAGRFEGAGTLWPGPGELAAAAAAWGGGAGAGAGGEGPAGAAPAAGGRRPYYTGEFAGGRPHGHGILVQPDGGRLEGAFRDGRPRGAMTLWGPGGDRRQVFFDEDGWPHEP